jgi:hypothetical protein
MTQCHGLQEGGKGDLEFRFFYVGKLKLCADRSDWPKFMKNSDLMTSCLGFFLHCHLVYQDCPWHQGLGFTPLQLFYSWMSSFLLYADENYASHWRYRTQWERIQVSKFSHSSKKVDN